MIHPERVRKLNSNDPFLKGAYILYWMQQDQRSECNHALEYAIQTANEHKKPLAVFFGLTDSYPGANLRHYTFMLRGLVETANTLKKRKIAFVIQRVSPEKGVIEMARDAAVLITDRGNTHIQTLWRDTVARKVKCPVIQVESNVVVPLETASEKENYSAGTLRPRIHRHLDTFLKPLAAETLKIDSIGLEFKSLDLDNYQHILDELQVDRSVEPVEAYLGGTSQARSKLKDFIQNKLSRFDSHRNDPSEDYLSNMSPYLHFGQVSPLYIALEVLEAKKEKKSLKAAVESYLEELIVRRELAQNFVYYNDNYDSVKCIPEWAQKSLREHEKDDRRYTYTQNQLETAQTHDPAWNAAQLQMVYLGKMHGYMRMYWGKKIIEWSKNIQTAFRTALYLNDKYELDGRDPNGYAGIAWCFGKHDRAWTERAVFGKIRYMNDAGLRRKFDIDKYINQVAEITGIDPGLLPKS